MKGKNHIKTKNSDTNSIHHRLLLFKTWITLTTTLNGLILTYSLGTVVREDGTVEDGMDLAEPSTEMAVD